jgi:hypothetical protein
MAEVIHHEDGTNSALLTVLIIVVIAIGAFLLWRYLPGRSANTGGTSQPGVNVNLNTGGGSDGSSGGTTY